MKRVCHPCLVLIGMLLLFNSWSNAQNAVPQLAYCKFEWKGPIKEAHTHALSVLHGAGYRVPEDQKDLLNVAYGYLPGDSNAPTLASHILCSTEKKKDQSHTNVIIVSAGHDLDKSVAECEKLRELMRHAGNEDLEASDSLVKGQRKTTSPGKTPADSIWLVHAFDLYSAYAGTHANAEAASHRVLDEMDLAPNALSHTNADQILPGAKVSDNIAAMIVTTENDANHQIQVHCYAAVCYLAPKNADASQLSKALYPAKETSRHYVLDMDHILMVDPGNSLPPVHPK